MADFAVAERGDAEADHHERDLRDGREGEYALDVDLCAGDDSGVEGSDGADDDDEDCCGILEHVDGEHASHQEYACHNHGGGVDECGNGSGAFHSVRQPDVEGHHSRFAHAAHENNIPNITYRDITESKSTDNLFAPYSFKWSASKKSSSVKSG